LKRLLRFFGGLIKWTIVVALGVELLCFILVSASNFLIYGQLREGSRAIYDPYTLFLQSTPVRPTANNSVSPDPTKNRTIWMLGGSTMRGATDFDDQTIPSHLAAILNGNGSGLRFTLINYGTDSFNALMEIKYLEKLLIENPAPPDLIVFYDGANDTKYFLEHRTADAHHGYRRVQALIESYYRSWFGLLKPLNAAIYASFTREIYDRINQVLVPLDPDADELRGMVDATEKRYDFVAKLANAFGVKFVVVWQPMLWVETCDVPPTVKAGERNLIVDSDRFETMRSNFTVVYTAITEGIAAKPYFVGFRRSLCDRQIPAYQADGVHLNSDGNKMVATAMAKLLAQRFPEFALPPP